VRGREKERERKAMNEKRKMVTIDVSGNCSHSEKEVKMPTEVAIFVHVVKADVVIP